MADKEHGTQKGTENIVGIPLPVKDQLHLLFQNLSSYAVFLHDPEGQVTYWNPGAELILGYRAEEMIGCNISILYPQEEVTAGIPQREMKLALSPGRAEVEGWRLRKDGSRFWADITIIAMRDEEHRLLGFGKIIRDATERRNADSSLKKSRSMFERLFENAPDATIVVDYRGVIRKVNKQVEPFFGYLREELLGQRIEILIPKRYHQAHRQHRKTYFADPRTRKMGAGLELYGLARDGREVPVDIMLSPIETDEGTWAFAVIRDITQHKQDEQAITELNDILKKQVTQLAATNRELETFSYSVSHDLRAPLRALDGMSLALLEDYSDQLDNTARNYLSRIRTAAQTMGELIDHLLTLSRLTRAEMHTEEVDLSGMGRQVAEEIRQQYPSRTVEFVINDEMNDIADPQLLRIAITNLLSNAWKFTSKKKKARVEFGVQESREGERVYFIRDNGAGFNQAYSDNLFKPFQRLHGTEEFPGTGIGLATVHRVISRHGGRIWAEGGIDTGATFYFTLAPS